MFWVGRLFERLCIVDVDHYRGVDRGSERIGWLFVDEQPQMMRGPRQNAADFAITVVYPVVELEGPSSAAQVIDEPDHHGPAAGGIGGCHHELGRAVAAGAPTGAMVDRHQTQRRG